MNAVSYHAHSRWSDGKASVGDMVAAAEAAGLLEFGLSDHVVLTPYQGTNVPEWAMPHNGGTLEGCLAELRQAAASAKITVRYGVEIDFYPETAAQTREFLDGFELDVVIGSVHAVDRFPIDSSAAYWSPLSQEDVNRVHRRYWQRIRGLAECGFADIIGHLDLPKKFGFVPDCDLSELIADTLDAIAAAGTAIELNTAGWDKPCREAYPDPDILRQARERGIPVVLSADAHAPGEVARHYRRGLALLRQVGYTRMLRFEARRPHEIPIPDPEEIP